MLLMFIVSFLGDSSPTNIAIAAGSYGSGAACDLLKISQARTSAIWIFNI